MFIMFKMLVLVDVPGYHYKFFTPEEYIVIIR